jgi:hypothetical protein
MGVLYNSSKSGYINPINNSVDKIMAASNGLVCLKNAIMGLPLNPSMLLMGLAGVAAALGAAIISAVTDIIYKRVGEMIDSILSPIRQIEAIIKDLVKTLQDFQDLIDKATNMDNYFQDKQQCANFGANLLDCLAQDAISKITNKVAMNVDKEVKKITDKVSKNAFKVDGTLSQFVNRQSKFLDKNSLQNKLL